MSAPGRPRGAGRSAGRASLAARRGAATPAAAATGRTAARHSVNGVERKRASLALGRCPERERLILALLLVEHLSPAEAASALGVSVRHLRSTYRETLANLRRAAVGMSTRPSERARSRRVGSPEARLRKAS